jgi:hypothetical protein
LDKERLSRFTTSPHSPPLFFPTRSLSRPLSLAQSLSPSLSRPFSPSPLAPFRPLPLAQFLSPLLHSPNSDATSMGRFREAANELLDCLWGKDVAAEGATDPKTFNTQLAQLKHHAAARRLAHIKPLDEPLTLDNVRSATAFAKYIFTANPPTENGIVRQKRLTLQTLDYIPFSILAILFNGEDLIKVAAPTFQALLEGAGKIAEWSSWPQSSELINAVREWKPAPAAVVTLSVGFETVQPPPNPAPTVIEPSVPCTASTRFQPAPPRAAVPPSSPSPATGAPDTACTALPTRPQPASRWVLTCSFCATVVRPRCACEHATGKRSDSSSLPQLIKRISDS